MSDDEENSCAEHEPGVSFADRQATAPMSVLAQITSKWVLDGVPFVTLLRSTTSSVTAANKIVKLMFNRDMTLRSTFTSDYAWALLSNSGHFQPTSRTSPKCPQNHCPKSYFESRTCGGHSNVLCLVRP